MNNNNVTILNYFGLDNTYNPFTDENSFSVVENIDFKIPLKEPFINSNYVAVSTGLLTTSLSFLNDCVFQILDPLNGNVISELKNIIGELGNDRYMPNENEIFWFNKDSLRGTFFLHKNYASKILRVVSGRFITTAITSSVLNDIFERTIGVPSYIENINSRLKDIEDNSTFIITENITKTSSGANTWKLNIRDDLEYLQVCATVNYSGSFNQKGNWAIGLFQKSSDINTLFKAPFIGWQITPNQNYYFGGRFETNFTYKADLANLTWYPFIDTTVFAMNVGSNSITASATIYYLVKKKVN